MTGSGMIRVLKRDRSSEPFNADKLAGAIHRMTVGEGCDRLHAQKIAEAIHAYLLRRRMHCVSSSALLEMSVKALRHVGLGEAAERAIRYTEWRMVLRRQIRVRQEGDRVTRWDKGWLREFTTRSWGVRPESAGVLANAVEMRILQSDRTSFTRAEVIAELNRVMAEYGLADAVPVRH